MGCQALGAAIGGLVASQSGTPQAITVALVLATVFCLWSAGSTPNDPKHLRRFVPTARRASEETVVDLVSLEADRPPATVS